MSLDFSFQRRFFSSFLHPNAPATIIEVMAGPLWPEFSINFVQQLWVFLPAKSARILSTCIKLSSTFKFLSISRRKWLLLTYLIIFHLFWIKKSNIFGWNLKIPAIVRPPQTPAPKCPTKQRIGYSRAYQPVKQLL